MPNPYANLTKLIQAVSLLAAPGGTTVKTLMFGSVFPGAPHSGCLKP